MSTDARRVAEMRRYWDARARENAPYFIENRLDYRSPDLAAFWAGGAQTVDRVIGEVGAPAIAARDVVVEVGCGIGRLTRPLAGRARHVHAIDVSAEMLARGRELNADLPNVDWILGDGMSLSPVAAGAASVVFSHVVFQHIPDPAITLAYVEDMGRVLAAGGWAAFQVSTDPRVHRRRYSGRLRRRLAAAARRGPAGQDHPAWLGSAVDPAALRATAAGAGLEVERMVGEGTQFCLVLLRRRTA